MSSCCAGSKKYSTYSVKGLKPCVSAPTCSTHRHRPRPAPCPRPDACYKKCKRKKQKCPSAMEVVSREGSRCICGQLQARGTRYTRKRRCKSRCQVQRHRTRIRKAYNTRSMISRWARREHHKRCCRCSKCCYGCTIL